MADSLIPSVDLGPASSSERSWGLGEKAREVEPTCPIQVYERLCPLFVMKALATVLLQLDLPDAHGLGDHLAWL